MTRQAPGKLLIAGEYAVLTPGQPAIVAAVDRYVTVTAAPAQHADIELITDLTDHPFQLHRDRRGLLPRPAANSSPRPPALTHLLGVLSTVEQLRAELDIPPMPVRLTVRSHLHHQGVKIGLGSSGAVTAAATEALLDLYEMSLPPEMRLRLALLATAAIDPHASGADVAAATFGGWTLYTPPDRDVLRQAVRAGGVAAALRSPWPGLSLRSLAPPTCSLHVGWTGSPASTPAQVHRLRQTAWWDSTAHRRFAHDSGQAVRALARALDHGDEEAVIEGISTAGSLLARLDQDTSVGIFTPALSSLCEAARIAGGAGKPSGAGGGDCGIALLPAGTTPQVLQGLWSAIGVRPLDLRSAPQLAALDRPPHALGPQPVGADPGMAPPTSWRTL
ncbi:phosphomevalonate kinase [Streptomyces sp. NPDC006733]|uniref:phosphomevalonate kinase n=1 Tax=Streptomyces sp. NPDC006733 TaxID=3155460 RepID=UPI0033E54D9F